MKEVTVSISQVVGGGICVAASDGHKVHDVIRNNILEGNRVRISFENVTRITTAFLNAAIGQLYGEFTEDEIRKHLAPPINADGSQLNRLKLVVDRAKQYFKNPIGARRVFLDTTGLEDE